MLAVSMPNSATFSALVETATKCLATALWSPPSPSTSQRRASRALVSVPWVVKVFDATMNRVAAGSSVRAGAVLGGVDVLAAEHRLGALAQPGALGQRDEQPDGLVGEPVLRVVQVEVPGPAGQPVAAVGVLGEQVPQVPVAQRAEVRGQC